MKRISLLLLFLGMAFISCKNKSPKIVITPDHEKNHLQKNHLFGNIKEIHTISYYRQDIDSVSQVTRLSSVSQHYSTDGYLLKVITNDENDTLVSIQDIFYHKNAKENYWTIKDAIGKITDSCQYYYDMNDFIAEEKRWSADSMIYSITYKTDGVGNIIELKHDNNIFTVTNSITYNQYGLVNRIDEYEPSGKLFKYTTIEYDNYGDEVNRRIFTPGDKLMEYTYYQYSNEGRLLKVSYENRMHNLTETRTYSDHDAQGNWLMEERKNLDNNFYIRKREIIYY